MDDWRKVIPCQVRVRVGVKLHAQCVLGDDPSNSHNKMISFLRIEIDSGSCRRYSSLFV